jgi:hypothetical protein
MKQMRIALDMFSLAILKRALPNIGRGTAPDRFPPFIPGEPSVCEAREGDYSAKESPNFHKMDSLVTRGSPDRIRYLVRWRAEDRDSLGH